MSDDLTVIDFDVQMKAEGKKAEVLIYDFIGPRFFSEGITAQSIRKQIDDLGEIANIDVRINSQGGEVFHAVAIYTALRDHPANVTVYIDGIAASAASLIAMAGDTIRISEAAFVMIHNPMAMAFGEAKNLRARAQMLEKIRKTAIASYSDRSGQSRSKVGEMMDAETWFTGEEAVEKGFADEVIANKTKPEAAKASLKADLSRFKNVPEGALKLAAMTAETSTPPEKESMTSETKPAETNVDEIAAAKLAREKAAANLALAKAKERQGETETPPAEDPTPADPTALAKAEERKRINQINALCAISGCPEKAKTFIDAEFSMEETRESLAKLLEKQNAALSADDSETPGESDPLKSAEKTYKAEYAERLSIHESLGISEEEYIEQRMFEDGHKKEPSIFPGLGKKPEKQAA